MASRRATPGGLYQFNFKRLLAACDGAMTAIVVFLRDGTIVYENRAAAGFHQLVFGRAMDGAAFGAPEHRDHPVATDWHHRLKRALATGNTQRWRASYPTANDRNSLIHVDCGITPYMSEAGYVAIMLGELLDITDLIERQRALELDNARLAARVARLTGDDGP